MDQAWQRTGLVVWIVAAGILVLLFSVGPLVWFARAICKGLSRLRHVPPGARVGLVKAKRQEYGPASPGFNRQEALTC